MVTPIWVNINSRMHCSRIKVAIFDKCRRAAEIFIIPIQARFKTPESSRRRTSLTILSGFLKMDLWGTLVALSALAKNQLYWKR